MPRRVPGAQRRSSPGSWHHTGDEQVRSRRFPVTVSQLRFTAAAASTGENSLARIWHGYLIFAAPRPLATAGQTGCSGILAGHPGVLLLAAGRFLRPRRRRRRCSAPLPYAAGPGTCTGFDLWLLVAGPGFEPGKTVVGDFTDRARYCPDLGEHQSNTPLWHAFDMNSRHVSYSPLRVRSPDRSAARSDSRRRLIGSVRQCHGYRRAQDTATRPMYLPARSLVSHRVRHFGGDADRGSRRRG
jgi:hypothetical protein